MLVDLSEEEIGLIHKAINSKYYDLLIDMIDLDVDNEEEQKVYKALLKKLDEFKALLKKLDELEEKKNNDK